MTAIPAALTRELWRLHGHADLVGEALAPGWAHWRQQVCADPAAFAAIPDDIAVRLAARTANLACAAIRHGSTATRTAGVEAIASGAFRGLCDAGAVLAAAERIPDASSALHVIAGAGIELDARAVQLIVQIVAGRPRTASDQMLTALFEQAISDGRITADGAHTAAPAAPATVAVMFHDAGLISAEQLTARLDIETDAMRRVLAVQQASTAASVELALEHVTAPFVLPEAWFALELPARTQQRLAAFASVQQLISAAQNDHPMFDDPAVETTARERISGRLRELSRIGVARPSATIVALFAPQVVRLTAAQVAAIAATDSQASDNAFAVAAAWMAGNVNGPAALALALELTDTQTFAAAVDAAHAALAGR